MRIRERVELYKNLFRECKAVEPVKAILEAGIPEGKIDRLEQIRGLNTALAELYEVNLPVITCWVRDSSYIPQTEEIYLLEPDVLDLLHEFRHHLQNVERRYERKGLTTEGDLSLIKVPYENCTYTLRGEDDARAWSKMVIELAMGEDQ